MKLTDHQKPEAPSAAPDVVNNQEYRVVPIEDLVPHPDNPNIGDRAGIAESIGINGFYGSVIVREIKSRSKTQRYQILGGEHRWLELREAGSTTVPVIVQLDCDDVQAVRIMLVDNESARRGRYRPDVLTTLLKGLGSLEGSGFSTETLVAFERERAAKAEAEAADEPKALTGVVGLDDEGEGVRGGDFTREYGVLITFDSEPDQEGFYTWLTEHGDLEPHQVRVVSI